VSILFIDLEHDRIVHDPVTGALHRTKHDDAGARLTAAAGEPYESVRFSVLTIERVRSLAPTAIVISGNTADWSEYDMDVLAGLMEVIRTAPVPILGICGGHQLIGHAHGAPWGPLGRLSVGMIDPDPRFATGLHKERGFLPVDIERASPLFARVGDAPVVFQSHYWHLTGVPTGFIALASSSDSPIQAIARKDRPVFGVQFHPERYDDDHRDGETILRNFFATRPTRRPVPYREPM